MTTTDAREISRDEAFALLERTDRHNGFRGIGRNGGPSGTDPAPLGLVLIILDAADRFILRPASAKDFSILEMRNPQHGWISYFVRNTPEPPKEASWP